MSVNMPCLKYCIRLIKNEDEQLIFSKMYFSLLKSSGLDNDEIIGEYAAIMSSAKGLVLSGNAISTINMYQYHGKNLSPDNYLENVLLDTQIQSFKNCYDYCKQCMSPVASLCMMCPQKNPEYAIRQEQELSLMNYLCCSFDNMQTFIDILGNSRKRIFTTSIDIAHDVFNSYPVVISVHSLLYKYIKGKGLSFYSEGTDIKSRLVAHSDKIISIIKNESTDAEQLSEKYGIVIGVELNKYIDAVANTIAMDKDQVIKMFTPQNKSSAKTKQKKPHLSKASENPSIIDVFNQMTVDNTGVTDVNMVSQKQREQAESNNISALPEEIGIPKEPLVNSDGSLPFSVPDDTAVEPEEQSTVTEPENLVMPANDILPELEIKDAGDKKQEAYTPDPEPEHQKELDSEVRISQPEVVSDKETENGDFAKPDFTPESTPKVEKDDKNTQEPKVEISEPKVTGDPLSLPVLNYETLCLWTEPYNEYDHAAAGAINKRRTLPIEIISDDKDRLYFIIYLPDFPKRLRIPLDVIPPSFDSLLCHKEITKIIWQPYLLYSLCKIKGIPVKGVHSILTLDILLNPNDSGRVYEKTLIRTLKKVPSGVLRDTNIKNDLLSSVTLAQRYLIGMSVYRMIYVCQTKELSSVARMEYLYSLYRDEVLGKSYLRSINLKENSVLFYLDTTGKVLFNTEFDYAVNREGFIDTYCVSPSAENDDVMEEFFLRFLADFAARGRFKKYNIQLVTMVEGRMILYIDASCHEAVTTYIQSYFNRYALKNGYERFELTVEHRRFSPDGTFHIDGKSASELSGPIEDVLDVLTTSDEVLEVKDNRIRGPKGEPFQRQKNTFPKKSK